MKNLILSSLIAVSMLAPTTSRAGGGPHDQDGWIWWLFGTSAFLSSPFTGTTELTEKMTDSQKKAAAAQNDAQVYMQAIESGKEPQMTRKIVEAVKATRDVSPELSEIEIIANIAVFEF